MSTQIPDTVILRTQKCRAVIPLLRLVISGAAAASRTVRIDQLDDLQLAVETLVVEEQSYAGDLVLHIKVEEQRLRLRLEGLCNQSVKALLLSPKAYGPAKENLINICMLLESLVNGFSVVEGPGDDFAVQLEKWTV